MEKFQENEQITMQNVEIPSNLTLMTPYSGLTKELKWSEKDLKYNRLEYGNSFHDVPHNAATKMPKGGVFRYLQSMV